MIDRKRKLRWHLVATTALYLAVLPNTAHALPQGSSVAAGSAVISTPSITQMDVHQSTQKAIINWNSFSINSGESVNFNQPSSSALTVNRVIGGDSSRILGNISANGNIMLINGNGILFGAGSKIDVGGLTATTIDIKDDRILANDFNFDIKSASNAKIINHGTITAAEGGLVALVAPGVENYGLIRAKLGKVTLASADSFTIDLYGDGLVKFPVTEEILAGGVINSGTIEADGGTIIIAAQTASRLIDDVINMDGVVQAQSIGAINGEIILMGGGEGVVNVTGTLDVSGDDMGETGGSIKVLGDKVGLFDNAHLSASGDQGGGQVLVGGGFQGKGAVQNAAATYVSEGAAIEAATNSKGNGGRVVVWADEITNFYGTIDVSAGKQSGNGGFVEVSGKNYLDFRGMVDRTAANGIAGTLLLDPRNLTINTTADFNIPGASPFDATGDNAVLTVATLLGALAGGNVVVTTGAGGAQAGDLTVASTIVTSGAHAGNNLTLSAANDLIVNADINMSASTTGSLTLNADNNLDLNEDITLNTGTMTLNADADADGTGRFLFNPAAPTKFMTTNGGDIVITMGNANGNDFVINTRSRFVTNGGDVTITPSILTQNFGGQIANAEFDRFDVGGGTVTIGGAGYSGDIGVTVGDIAGAGTTDTFRFLTTGTFSSGGVNMTDNNLIISAGKVIISGAIIATGKSVTIQPTTAGNAVDLGAVGDGTAATVEISDAELDFITANTLTIGSNAAGAINVSADISPANITDLHLISGAGVSGNGIIVSGLAVDAGSTINLVDAQTDVNTLAINAAGQTVSFRDTDDLTIGTVNGVVGMTSAALNLMAEGIIVNNDITTTGATVFNADFDNNGTGNFTVAATRTVNTGGNALNITAADLILNGNINMGAALATIQASAGRTLGFGNTGANFSFDRTEIGRFTTSLFTIGGSTTGDITIDNILAADGLGTTTLIAGANGADITFANNASTFDTLIAQADDGINVNINVSTDVGDLTLSADTDSAADAIDSVNFGALATAINAAGQITLNGATGNGTLAGNLTLTAGGAVTIATKLDGNFNLDINAGANNIGITGALGPATPLATLTLTGGALTGDINADTVNITGTSAVLTGTVMGGNNAAAAQMISLIGPQGAGPYTLNSFNIVVPSSGGGNIGDTPIQGGVPGRSTNGELASTIGSSSGRTQVAGFEVGGRLQSSPVFPDAQTDLRNTPGDFMTQSIAKGRFMTNIFTQDFSLVHFTRRLRELLGIENI